MSIETTPIYDEVKKIFNGTEAVFFKWTCEFIAGKETVVPFRIISIDIVRNYNRQYTDDIQISVMFPEGAFNKYIIPNLDTIEVVLKRSPITAGGAIVDVNNQIQSQRYRGIFLEEPVSYMKGGTPDNINFVGADLSNLKTVQFQLMDMAVEQLRGRAVGGIFRNTTAADVLKLILGKESKKIDVPAEVSIKGVNMVEPSNTTVKDHIIVRHGVELLALPSYLQNECGGIYSAGMGFYLQQGIWYVYPEFDTTRFKKELQTLTVIRIPPNKMPSVERTYRTTGNQVIVLSTGEFIHTDDSDNQQLNLGNGYRFTNADNVVDKFGKYNGGKFTIDRTSNNSEFEAMERGSGINKIPVSKERITSNPFTQYSQLARRNCMHVQFVWENSNYSLIYPGMPCKLIWESDGAVQEIQGVVNQAHHFTTGQGNTMVDARHVTHSTVTILVTK